MNPKFIVITIIILIIIAIFSSCINEDTSNNTVYSQVYNNKDKLKTKYRRKPVECEPLKTAVGKDCLDCTDTSGTNMCYKYILDGGKLLEDKKCQKNCESGYTNAKYEGCYDSYYINSKTQHRSVSYTDCINLLKTYSDNGTLVPVELNGSINLESYPYITFNTCKLDTTDNKFYCHCGIALSNSDATKLNPVSDGDVNNNVCVLNNVKFNTDDENNTIIGGVGAGKSTSFYYNPYFTEDFLS